MAKSTALAEDESNEPCRYRHNTGDDSLLKEQEKTCLFWMLHEPRGQDAVSCAQTVSCAAARLLSQRRKGGSAEESASKAKRDAQMEERREKEKGIYI